MAENMNLCLYCPLGFVSHNAYYKHALTNHAEGMLLGFKSGSKLRFTK